MPDQEIYRFENGYGASVVQQSFSYGGGQGLWELAVVRFKGPDAYDWSICYDTSITKDVLGRLDREEVEATLDQIAALPRFGVIETLQLASAYIQYVKERNIELHREADGTPSIEEAVSAVIIEAARKGAA